MDKLKLFENFEQLLKEKFPGRPKPITKNVEPIEQKQFNDSRFDEWRKVK